MVYLPIDPQIARVILLIFIGLITYTYVGYPAFIFVVASIRKHRPADPNYYPFISVLIAAYNEESHIANKLRETLSLDYPAERIEVIVLSDCSSDSTDRIVHAFPDPRVRLLRMDRRRGKTHAQNEGVKIAKGEVLIFSDATTKYHPQALRYLACNYQDGRVGAVTGRNQYFDPQETSPTGLGTVAFWNYENIIKSLQSRIYTLTGCVGCIYSVRKSAYTELPEDIISDLVQPLWAIQKGYRVLFEPRALAYETTTKSMEKEFSMRVRVVTRGMRGLLSVPGLLVPWNNPWVSFQLYSHKILRWMIPFFLIGTLLCCLFASQVGWVLAVLALQLGFYATAIAARLIPLHLRWSPLGIPLYFCTLNAAALVSFCELLRGKKYVVWDTMRKEELASVISTRREPLKVAS